VPPATLSRRFENGVDRDAPLPSVVRFQASATEQEIWRGALGAPDAKEHVLACFREIDNRREFSPAEHTRDFIDLVPNSVAIDEGPQRALDELKDELRSRLGEDNIFTHTPPAHLVPAKSAK